MNTATTNPPIRIRRITAPAIEASKDPGRRHWRRRRPSLLHRLKISVTPPEDTAKRSFGSFASFGPEKTEGNPANDPAKCRPGAMPYSARAAAGLHTIGAKHVQPNSSRSNRHPDRSP
jgi:hypothetical protein